MNKLLTIKEISQILKISISKAYSLTNDKDFPVIKLGKSKRVFEEDLFFMVEKTQKCGIIFENLKAERSEFERLYNQKK